MAAGAGVLRRPCLLLVGLAIAVAGCASRPVNPPLKEVDRGYGYRTEGRAIQGAASDTMVVLAFSGGGTRAAAYSYGVLEELRRTDVVVGGRRTRLLDEIVFENATFGDLVGKPGPVVIATATDISTGSRLGFVQGEWDLVCSDLSKVTLSRAEAPRAASIPNIELYLLHDLASPSPAGNQP